MTSFFTPTSSDLFFSKKNNDDIRLGDLVKSNDSLIQDSMGIIGYPDDEGIKNNSGRPGAALAPDCIRHYLYKMTPPLDIPRQAASLFDLGNLKVSELSLDDRHKHVSENVYFQLSKGGQLVTFGGGHDYGYSDAAGFYRYVTHHLKEKPLIVNFDAHLDVRPLDKGITSGTPFYKLLNEFPDIDFLEIGIQPQCNSKSHLAWAREKGTHIFFQSDILYSHQNPYVTMLEFFEPWLIRKRPVMVSLDIDVFSSSFAPGCSQSWPLGLAPHDLYKVLSVLYARWNVLLLGIYEVSPPLDVQDMTSKLAAQFAYQYLYK